MEHGLSSWTEVVNHDSLGIQEHRKRAIIDILTPIGELGSNHHIEHRILTSAPFERLLAACPCLYAQLEAKVTASAVVHLCEVTLNQVIRSENVYDAFLIQHPSNGEHFRYPPRMPGASGGDIMEKLCSEVLTNHGVPIMDLDAIGWPMWGHKHHLSLNDGAMRDLKLYGDILIPCAPHNLLISVKSEAARERFVVSGNRLESVGFGFFNDASEFWTQNRIRMLKRWGFLAVYMPSGTHNEIIAHLATEGHNGQNQNINGTPLFRSLEQFGPDMERVAGKLSMSL